MIDGKIEKFNGNIPANILEAFADFIEHIHNVEYGEAFYNQRSRQCGVFVENGRIVLCDAKNLVEYKSPLITASEPAKIHFPSELLKKSAKRTITVFDENAEAEEVCLFPKPNTVLMSEGFAMLFGVTEKDETVCFGSFFNGDAGNVIAGSSWRATKTDFLKSADSLFANFAVADYLIQQSYFPAELFAYLGKALLCLGIPMPEISLKEKNDFKAWEVSGESFSALIASAK